MVFTVLLRLGIRRTSIGRRLVGQRWYVDVVVVLQFLPAILPLLLPGEVWKESRSERRLHTVLFNIFH